MINKIKSVLSNVSLSKKTGSRYLEWHNNRFFEHNK